MDRGFVFRLVSSYMKEAQSMDRTFSYLKLEFLHILCSHEHYVVLNLPFPTGSGNNESEQQRLSPSPSMNSIVSAGSSIYSMLGRESGTISELSYSFREQHFLVGLLLCEVKNSFDSK